jgi:hypothetical protein
MNADLDVWLDTAIARLANIDSAARNQKGDERSLRTRI